MLVSLRNRSRETNRLVWLVAPAVLVLAFLLGQRPSLLWVGLIVAGLGGAILLARPALGLFALVVAALLVPFEIGTGTEVQLNAVTLLIPAVGVVWLLDRLRHGRIQIVHSPVNRPLLLFLAAGLLSLLIGRATWDPAVPVKSNFVIVQLAQWGIFAFSALAFWLTAHLARDEKTLWRLTACFLVLGGGVAVLRALPGLGGLTAPFTTIAFIRAPFWVLLAALAAGQLIWNDRLDTRWRIFLVAVLAAVLVYAFVEQQEAVSNWLGVATVGGVLVWLRFPRVRIPLVGLVGALAVLGLLVPAVYDFAGGEEEWVLSGGSRLTLIERVVEVTMRNPLTGLGPAAYRPYANARPLFYEGAFWVAPLINSHNNYVDLFAHGGLLGLALFAWFCWEVAHLGRRLMRTPLSGMATGYTAGLVAAGAAALVLMLLADWMLPFVYNIGFPGFQAAVLVWLFLGGLVALENFSSQASGDREQG